MSRANPRFRRINPNLPLVGANNGVVQYVVQGQIENQMTLSTFMYAAPVPTPTLTQQTTLLTNISNGLFPAYKNLISADWTAVRELLRVVHRNDLSTVQSVARTGTAGGRPAGHAPTEVAGIFLRVTAFKGQHARGRVSIPAVSLTDVTASSWVGVALAALQLLFDSAALATASDGTNTWTPCIGQRGATPPKLIVGFASVTSYAASTLLGTVRRRKIGRGK